MILDKDLKTANYSNILSLQYILFDIVRDKHILCGWHVLINFSLNFPFSFFELLGIKKETNMNQNI